MAGLTGPLFSLDASGTIAKTLTYAKWRGIRYVRQRVIPANPNSTLQQNIRGVFRSLNAIWLYIPGGAGDSYLTASAGRPLTNRNLFIQRNAKDMYDAGDYSTFQPYAPSKGGPGGIVNAPVDGSGTVTVTVTPPTTPTGWTLDFVWGTIIRDSNPYTDPPYATQEHFDGSSAYVLTFTGLTNGATYYGQTAVGWTKPDGTEAYSVSAVFTGSPA